MKKDEIVLGDVARDTITKYQGVIVCISSWLNGCVRVTLQATGLKDGKPFDQYTCDVEQLEVTKRVGKSAHKPGGGPMPEPSQRPSPRR